jgi:hypothetical protein
VMLAASVKTNDVRPWQSNGNSNYLLCCMHVFFCSPAPRRIIVHVYGVVQTISLYWFAWWAICGLQFTDALSSKHKLVCLFLRSADPPFFVQCIHLPRSSFHTMSDRWILYI